MISWEEYVSDDNKKNSSANDPLSSSTFIHLLPGRNWEESQQRVYNSCSDF